MASATIQEAYEKLEDTWLSMASISKFIAYFSGFVALLYPLVFVTMQRWAGWQGFSFSLLSILLFLGFRKVALYKVREVHQLSVSHKNSALS